MPNAKYKQGRYYEHKTMRYLESHGYQCIRSAGSKGSIDVVGYCEGGIVFVQVKCSPKRRGPSKAERTSLARVPVIDNVTVYLFIWIPGVGEPIRWYRNLNGEFYEL
jgi:hypothetical protein